MTQDLAFLKFQDWLKSKENEQPDWIIIARCQEIKDTESFSMYYTFSILASPASEESLNIILSSHDWEINRWGGSSEFGKPTFEDPETYTPNWKTRYGEIEFQPIVFDRSFHGYKPNTFELFQTFILYHDAFFEPEVREYHMIDQDGSIQTVARIRVENENDLMIEIDTHHLKDYLAANNAYLIRYHDHRRWIRKDIREQIGETPLKYPIRDDTCIFELVLYRPDSMDEYNSASTLLGKDVVFPYPKPDRRHISRIFGDNERKFEKFIIGRDEQGVINEVTCNRKELAPSRYLTKIFFSRPVLDKYIADSRYDVSERYVGCMNIWGIEISINEEDMVVVYLGDLGRIPFEEQKHWKLYNKTPRGGMPEERIKRDFFNIVEEPENYAIYVLRREFDSVQSKSSEKLGESLFKKLDEREVYLIEKLHLPTKQEWKEFDDQILALSKYTSDALNVKLLKKLTGLSINKEGPNKGPVDLLERFLEQELVSSDIIEQIMEGFRVVQRLRSSGTAHRKDAEFDRILRKYDLSDLSNYDKVKKIIKSLTHSLSLLLSVLSES